MSFSGFPDCVEEDSRDDELEEHRGPVIRPMPEVVVGGGGGGGRHGRVQSSRHIRDGCVVVMGHHFSQSALEMSCI